MFQNKHSVIAVVGPTASGKTALGVKIAKAVNGEVVSSDSMQVYNNMPIASAAPTAEEVQGIPHHLVGFKDPAEKFSVADFITLASEKIEDIVAKKPDVVFVAMGSPKQELLMEEISKRHPAIYQGLGGSFDVYTGNVKRAPEWWVNHNLEWAYRLIKEPTRIKRQIHLVRFMAKVKMGQI